MDPKLFHVDWEQLAEVLSAVVILAFAVERALSILFENRYFIARVDQLNIGADSGFRSGFATTGTLT